MSCGQGISVPDIMAIDCIRFHDVDWILVIEKEVGIRSSCDRHLYVVH